MKHTAGPCTIQAVPHRNGHRSGFYYCIRDSRNINLAVVGEVDAATDGAEAEANAHLYAAAPELLKAPEDAIKPLDYEGSYEEWEGRARAAIKAARGDA